MKDDERRLKIAKLRDDKNKINKQLSSLIYDCSCYTNIINKGNSAVCSVCGKEYGWFCPNSPDHICDYEQKDGSYDEDSCIYCGQPEERK